MNDELGIAHIPKECLSDVVKSRLLEKEFRRDTGRLNGIRAHWPVRIQIVVKRVAREFAVDHLDSGDLHNTMALFGLKPSGIMSTTT